MVAYEQINLFTLLIVCVPATLLGAIAAGLSVMKRGKELSEDPEYLERVKACLLYTSAFCFHHRPRREGCQGLSLPGCAKQFFTRGAASGRSWHLERRHRVVFVPNG